MPPTKSELITKTVSSLSNAQMGLGILWTLTTIVGSGLGLWFTITPPPDDRARHQDFVWTAVFVGFAIVSAIAVLVVSKLGGDARDALYEERAKDRHAEMMEAVNAVASAAEASVIADEQATEPLAGKISFSELAEAHKAAETAGNDTEAATIFRSVPKANNLQQQVFDLVRAAREALIKYHGSLDADSFVAPEITAAFTKQLLAVKNKIQRMQGHDILRYEAKFPVTVRRMAMFLEDIENAGAQLPNNIPPFV